MWWLVALHCFSFPPSPFVVGRARSPPPRPVWSRVFWRARFPAEWMEGRCGEGLRTGGTAFRSGTFTDTWPADHIHNNRDRDRPSMSSSSPNHSIHRYYPRPQACTSSSSSDRSINISVNRSSFYILISATLLSLNTAVATYFTLCYTFDVSLTLLFVFTLLFVLTLLFEVRWTYNLLCTIYGSLLLLLLFFLPVIVCTSIIIAAIIVNLLFFLLSLVQT